MSWRITFRYNGRVEGANKALARELADRPDDGAVRELEREALRINGSIFVNGWSVEWLEEPLEDEPSDPYGRQSDLRPGFYEDDILE